VESDAQFTTAGSLSMQLSSVDTLPRSSENSVSFDLSACSVLESVLSKDFMLDHQVKMEDRVTGDSSMDCKAEDSDWFSYKAVSNDDLGVVHEGLDLVDIDDCASVCNSIVFDPIIDVGLNTSSVMTGRGSQDCAEDCIIGQPELLSGQSCFSDSTNPLFHAASGDNLLCSVDNVQDKGALNTAVSLDIQIICPDTVSVTPVPVKPTSTSADVPSCVASDVAQLSSVRRELATSFLTPKTPTHPQGLPTYATHFSFSSPDMLQNSPVLVSRPKTPVVSISVPVSAHPQISPHAPYTPDTPSVFQFPSPNQSPASDSGCSPAACYNLKRHAASYHPYSSQSASTSSPRYLNQQQASAQQLEQQKRLEVELAEAHSEIDEYVRRLQLADLQRRHQLQMQGACQKEMSSKLSVTVPTTTGLSSDINSGDSTAASCGQAVSPIEEVIQILVAEHFGVTVPSKILQDNLKHAGSDVKVDSELSNLLASADGTVQQPVTEEFRNPSTVSTSKPRKRKPEPLVIPASVSNFGFRSQLRSLKLSESDCVTQQCPITTTPPYTPPPMISPARSGSGVFWTLHGARRQIPSGSLSAPACRTKFPCMSNSLLYY